MRVSEYFRRVYRISSANIPSLLQVRVSVLMELHTLSVFSGQFSPWTHPQKFDHAFRMHMEVYTLSRSFF